ncbi:exported hypothetical protein [Mesorhizobium escarrei]|uniref:Uncharacterized protein n=1 Tax=Mesorhizobium escarrei TaxID=666018 RepID=A0ABM9EG07_9HYPH|nr:exported hypothetical protein [Mesorhizobium escarrei]
MSRPSSLAGLVLGLVAPVAVPAPAQAVTNEINIGTNLDNGRAITCREGGRLLRNRGFRDVRRVVAAGAFSSIGPAAPAV